MKHTLLALAAGVGIVSAACPNDCSGHGVCDSAQCECYRNWFGPDCSDRVCTFGRAFIDNPTGDLNGDGLHEPSRAFDPSVNTIVQGISHVVGGRSELYDEHYGYARGSRVVDWDEAHFYRECSNKGICDRSTGQCDCFPGYWGEGCDRTVCPNDCSGHGMCRTLADSYEPLYFAWDLHKTTKCECDPGFSGPDCSLRLCPRGADPVQNAQIVTNSIQGIYWNDYFYTSSDDDDSINFLKDKPTKVYYTVTFIDEYDDEWVTQLLSVNYESACDSSQNCYSRVNATIDDIESYAEAVNNSLAALPGNVVNNHYVWTTGNTVDESGSVSSYEYYPNSGHSGESIYTDSLAFRLDLQVVPDHCYNPTSGHVSGMCTFIKVENPGKQNALQVKGWYTPMGQLEDTTYSFETINFGATDFAKNHDHVSNSTADVLIDGPLVVVDDVQGDRQWTLSDGDVVFAFIDKNIRDLDVCSKRGVCDFSTGLCKCFSGYSGIRCDTQNSISFSF